MAETSKSQVRLHIGTSGWSYRDWRAVFYPQNATANTYLNYYAQHFRTVEVDSTFYGIPRPSTVQNWFRQTPDDFVFTLKVPKMITHEKRLQHCEDEWQRFLQIVSLLHHKAGPLILQFDYKFEFKPFFPILEKFLRDHHGDRRLAVEIRHRSWHQEPFYEMLSRYQTALVLNDLYYMPRLVRLTSVFTVVRLLGNRKQIPDDFSRVRIERGADLQWWAGQIRNFLQRNLEVYVYSNNRYQGHAPATVGTLLRLIQENGP